MVIQGPVFSHAGHRHLANARQILHANHRAFSDVLDRSGEAFGGQWADEFDTLIGTLFPTDVLVKEALHGYVRFATDSLRLQARFEKTGVYRSSSYAEAAVRVYHNESYMMSQYLPGLLLSHYLWPHHYRQLLFFDSAFVRHLRDAKIGRFSEVGIGTGLYSRRLLQAIPKIVGSGYDISASAQAFVGNHLSAFGLRRRYQVSLQNIVTKPPQEQVEALICVEVLEHLEDPVEFLRALRCMLKSGGRAFITAAVSADHADHIYLYRTAGEVEAHLVEAGFVVEQSFVAVAYPPRFPGQPLPIAAAFIVL